MKFDFKGILALGAAVGLLIGGGIGSGATYLVCKRSYRAQLTEARDQAERAQAYQDSLHYAGKLASKDIIISEKQDENLLLRSRIKSDSIRNLSQQQSIRAVNRYITGKK
ncbi:hypothetical protein BWI97_07255 [Siphonobacter sp. BAB-5405]|uniref:hypothetical protein n=1 Tax=Siphonobacter sp. BAB-5405 TaxID=1864825 RepID=UPI000C80F701|nr:hypothetical protein [Siphonobacter sp. BAB-5405]PMD97420.1 hypothetical protein BWI97_07255 [Siphonobacter sp. BAB-5405]